ncbi:MAG: hypothetical protein ACT4OG_04360 [Alphaproteobacteria bacterium]
MKTIFKGALAALAIAFAPMVASTPAQANVGVGIYAGSGDGYISVHYRDRYRCGYYDRWGHWRSYPYRYCRSGYYRPYHRAYSRHSYCWYHPYSWRCRYHRY